MRRSMRRWMVEGLYWEKSWPVWARSRMKIFFSAFSVWRVRGRGPGRLAEGVGHIGDELGGHLGRRQLVVHQAGGDGAARHAVVFGGGGVLGHDHAALALDGPHAQGAVAAGAGEHDADGPLALVLGQGAEEEVDGQALAAGREGSSSWSVPFRKAMSRLGGMM
jgi:hypothetical protein